jgi:antitoxin MazE
VRTRIIKIGNSQGIRIPKVLLEEAGLSGDVDLSVQNGALVVARARQTREGWAEAFKTMAAHGDDALLDGYAATSGTFDEGSWEWTQSGSTSSS